MNRQTYKVTTEHRDPLRTAHYTQKTKTRPAVLTIREGYGVGGERGRIVAEITLTDGKREAKQQAAAHGAKPWDF